MLAGIDCLENASRLAAPLAALGYDDAGTDIVPGHHLFGKGPARTHLLHVVEYQSALWREALKFRDAVRAGAALAQEYEVLKIRSSKKHAGRRADYTASKAAFIRSVLDKN